MSLYLCLNPDGTSVVSESNPIQTRHTSQGEPVTVPIYIVNDGKRTNVPNDLNPPELIYTNMQVKVEGVGYSLENALTSSTSDVTLTLSGNSGWNIGTILKSGLERMRIEEIISTNSVRVQRNYTSDGKSSVIQSHQVSTMIISETTDVSLALARPDNNGEVGSFLAGGAALTTGFDPTNLVTSVTALETANVIRSTDASLYSNGNLIQIDNEIMKIISISGNDITVQRGYRSNRASHTNNAVIYCVGIRDINKTHKFYVKVDPPSGLPTQKKRDVKIVIVSDEEPA